VWVGARLLLARRVELEGQTVIQGCWLDWPRIRESLIEEAADLLSHLELEPVVDVGTARPNRMLATLPVQLVVPPIPAPAIWSAMRTTLAIAWSCFGVLAASGALLLHGILSLSERRAAFVSAVTHELRTPLTTFRLYSEMLAQGMLPDESQRQKYLQTLHGEADRLARLVDNVLYYSRLERGRATRHRERISVGELIERCQERLAERARQGGLQLETECPPESGSCVVDTDASAVEQILFNLVDNAAKYARRSSDRQLQLTVERPSGRIAIRVRDHGPGVATQVVRRLFQPFSKSAEDAANSAPGVGLGLALSRRLARELGGQLTLEENSSRGATFLLTLPAA
jgi:signal transduction histidine kinase